MSRSNLNPDPYYQASRKRHKQRHEHILDITVRKSYKRRIRCWQCHDSVEEAPALFCSNCHARLLWYNLHLEPGERLISYAYPEPSSSEQPPLAIIGYTRPSGVQGQYKVGGLYRYNSSQFPNMGPFDVFENDTFEHRITVGFYYFPSFENVALEDWDKHPYSYLMHGVVPGNIIMVEARSAEVAYPQQYLFRVLPDRIVRVGIEERKRMQTRRFGFYVEDPDRTADLLYVPLVDLDNLDESLWLEAVHQRNAKPEIAHLFLTEIHKLLAQQSSFMVSSQFLHMHVYDNHPDPGVRYDHHHATLSWHQPEKTLAPYRPTEIPVEIELTNKQAGLIVLTSEASLGNTINLSLYYEERERFEKELYQIPGGGFWGGMDAVVEAFPVGESTKYAAVFDSIPLPLHRKTDEPRSSTCYHLNTRDDRRVYLKPGKVEVVDLVK